SLVLNCGFTNNRAIYTSGGSVHIQSGNQSRLVGCTITGSYAGDSGGGVNIREGSTRPQLIEVLVANSRAVKYGGGIACREAATPSFEDVVVTNCSAILGGGVYADGTTCSTFDRCRLYGNRAESAVVSADGGGAYFTDSAVGRLTRCVFQGNSADNDGAGFIALGTAALTVTNTWLLSNQATNTGGGAKFTSSSSGMFQNCTIVGNTAITNGGGGLLLDSQATVVIDCSIVYSNRFDGIADAGGSLAVNWSCVQPPWLGGWSGIGNTNVNPMLDSAGLLLLDGSPCIDAGNPFPALNDAARPPGKGTPRNDMGATGGPMNGWTPAASETLWIPASVLWSYHDLGSEPAGNWRAAVFDDSNWNHGLAKFGYGGDGEVTTVNFGTNSAQKFISTYFRCTFNVPDLAVATNLGPLEARLICDDGAVVYLNGVEAFRYNMPAGTIGYSTLASSDIIGADENRWFSFPLDPRLLVQGANVVAAEVHQVSPASGDLGFDLQLATRSGFTPGPKTIYVNDDSTVGDVITTGAGNDNNTGLNRAYPLRHLAAIFARYTLEPGDTICLDTGVYKESVILPSGVSGITLLGAGMDRSIIDAGMVTNCLVLDGVLGVTIKDLTLRHGKAAQLLYGLVRGGALLCTWSDLYLTNVALRDSTADYGGGAWVDHSEAILDHVVFSGNLATNQGGGLFLDWTRGDGSRHVATNCVLSGNQAYQQGGGIFVVDGLIQACTMNGNIASDHGGGAYLCQRSRIEGCSLTANQANYGGGVYLGDWAAMRDCTITSNTASLDGGGLRTWSSTPLSNCVFVGNIATNSGGGANLWGSALA
ncbi:MAG: right-handed parallel beta-helix repeat-containing protein, partial [Verrucomicrobia bacterium]|nr:right-handed parallel beta-helix repeat-containing protein [Verrucomicrobiota bacterium]